VHRQEREDPLLDVKRARDKATALRLVMQEGID
jgi:hypothetical protein